MDNLLNEKDDQPVIDEGKDYLAELVGEDKKFKDAQALAKGKAFSDAHIALLERRFDELSEDYKRLKKDADAGARLQELLDKMENQPQHTTSREPTVNSNEVNTKPALGLDEVESLVSSKIQQHEQTRRERENFAKVEALLKERLGSNFKAILKEKSTSLGLTDDEVNTMARKNPNLFSKTFDLDAKPQESFQAPPRNSSTFTPKGSQKRGWSYYQDLKKKDPTAWMQPKVAIQMLKDAQEMGEKEFYSS
jgi:hypothetical protein